MVRDVTSEVQRCLSSQLVEAIEALTTLNKHFGRETTSAALGEISECLVSAYVGGERRNRNTKGHDVLKGEHLIEVKSRVIDHWEDDAQYNFKKYTEQAHTAYCLAWRLDGNKPVLQHVFQVEVPFLIQTWAKPNQPIYCARTTLGKLKGALGANAT